MRVITLRDVEKDHILYVLDVFDYNRTKSAKALGISLKTITNKLKTYGIQSLPYRSKINLNEEQKKYLLELYEAGETYEYIGNVLGITTPTIFKLIHREFSNLSKSNKMRERNKFYKMKTTNKD